MVAIKILLTLSFIALLLRKNSTFPFLIIICLRFKFCLFLKIDPCFFKNKFYCYQLFPCPNYLPEYLISFKAQTISVILKFQTVGVSKSITGYQQSSFDFCSAFIPRAKFCVVQFCLAVTKSFTAHMVKNLNTETEKSGQTLFARVSPSRY